MSLTFDGMLMQEATVSIGPGSGGCGPGGGRGRRWRQEAGREQDALTVSDSAAAEEVMFAGRGRHRRTLMELATLTVLAEAEAHGYRLLEKVDDLVGAEVCVDPGSLYRLLRGLEQDGYVISAWETAESGPSRRVYQITPAGRRLMADLAGFVARRAQAMERLCKRARSLAGPVANEG